MFVLSFASESIRSHLSIPILLLLLISTPIFAQDESLELGSTLKTQNEVKLHTEPPSQKLLFLVDEPGSDVRTLKEGEEIQVQEIKKIVMPFRKDVWLKGKTQKGETGWVYYGDDDKSANFISTKGAQ